ncbi:unnamed protein product [Rotaria socialis]|uniref:Uncharacterized protein n=1 Tax=Rotaria socialis TaxID=392032 RepID=A0A818ENP2_9BILA|nr:unnamed protein product [Rotaria socialis]CAF3617068.1 unnamed protein product [Rotaria socialis]CAF4325602.1 unnamed protein product [Rotaria socialis]CAF4659634.1 unnamed protein product [Rotaria socialis]
MPRARNRSDSPPPYTITKSNDYDEQSIGEESSNEPFDDTASSDQLSWLSKIAYASVGLPYSMQLSIIAFYINEFLLDVAKVSPGYNAIILFTSRLIDALTDPIGGYLFSRCSFRWGKMRPWILFSAPCVALSYFGVWCLPNISGGGKLAYYLLVHSLLWTFMTASRIPHTALTVYLTLNQHERDQLTKYRTLFEAAGLLLSIVFQSGIAAIFGVSKVLPLCDDNSTNTSEWYNSSIVENSTMKVNSSLPNVAGAYMTSAGIVSLLCILSSVFLFFSVTEVVDVIPTNQTSYTKGFKMIIRYKPFLILTAATVASILATQSIQSVLELYLNNVKKNRTIFPFLAGTLIVSTMILLFVWSIIMRKIGKKKSFVIGNLCLIPTVIIILISESPMALLFVAAIMGANTVACGYIMPWAMLPECIDAFMLETGRRPVEIFYTFFFLGAKLVQALYAGVVQLALGASGYDSTRCEQPEAVQFALKILMGAVPGCVLVLSTICLYFYSIDDERAKEIQIQLKTLRDTSSPEKGLVNDSNKMDNESADVYL